jgi:Protein of unknown function (DUF2971)
MLHGFVDPEELVYHYASVEAALEHILATGKLRLSSYETTNDPAETKSCTFGLVTTGPEDLGSHPHIETSSRFSSLLKKNARLVCFSTDVAPLTGDDNADILNRGFAKPRMWAQYGRNHTGVCLVFNKARLLESLRLCVQSPPLMYGLVRYRNRVPLGLSSEFVIDIHRWESLGPETYARQHIAQHYKPLFLEKLLDWRDENEWRAILWSDDDEPIFCDIADALVGVIHGARIDVDKSIKIAESTDDTRVKHMGLTWKNSAPWYNFEAT